jgi:hypothetical protein
MATFNPEVNFDRTPQFLNYSQGVRDNSAATLVGGLTEAFDNKIKATDRALSQMAQDEVRNTVNETDANLLGVGPAVPSKDPLENEVRSQVRNLDRQRKAMDAGTISPDYYYATLQAKVKEIRTRYAGYPDVIDNELKSMGIDPNYQRTQILAQAAASKSRAANAAAEADRNNREFLERAITAIPLPKDLRERAIQPNAHQDPEFMKRIKLQTNSWVSMKGEIEAQKMEAELLDVNDKHKANALGEAYNRELQTGVYAAVTASTDWKQFQESSRKVQEQASSGQQVSPADQEQLRASFAAVRTKMQEHKLSVKARYAENAGSFTKEMDQADKLFDNTLDGFEKGLNDPSTGLLSYNIAAIEGRIKGKQFDIVKNSEQASGLAASRALFGDVALAEALRTNGDQALEPLRADIQNNALIDQATKKDQSLIGTIRNVVANPKANDANAVGQTIDNTVSLFINPNTRPEGKKVLAGVLFHKDNKEFFDQMLSSNMSDAQKRDYVTKFASPVMYNEVKKLNDPVALNKYVDTVSYASARLNRETAATIQDIKEFASFKDISYNSGTNRLEVTDREPGGSTPNAKVANQFFSYLKGGDRTAEDAVANVNKALDVMTPIWRDQGVDVGEASKAFIGALGINPEAPKKGNILERGVDFLKNPQDYIGGSQGKDKAGGGAGEDNLQNFRLAPKPGAVNPDQVRSLPAVLSGRVEDYLVSRGVGKDAASTVGKALGGLTGVDSVQMAIDSGDPLKIAQESALAALTLIPGAALEKGLPALSKEAVSVVQGGVAKVEDFVKTLPGMSDAGLRSSINDLLKKADTLRPDASGPEGELVARQLNAVAQEFASRLSTKAGKPGITKVSLSTEDLANGITRADKIGAGEYTRLDGPITSERWDAMSKSAALDLKDKIVSLDAVKTAKESLKAADDMDKEASVYISKTNDTFSKSVENVINKGNEVLKDLPRLYRLAQDTGDTEVATHIADFMKMQEVYGSAAQRTASLFDTVSKFPSNKQAQRAYDRAYQVQKTFEGQISDIVDLISQFKKDMSPKPVK